MNKVISAVSCCMHSKSASENTCDNNNGDILDMNTPGQASTFQHQASLPRLPIPALDATLAKFLSTVEPLLSKSQFEETKKITHQFQTTDGKKLQKILQKYDSDGEQARSKSNTTPSSIGSYIEEFWNDAYLAPDTSVVLNLNPFFLLEDDPDAKKSKHQIRRASSLVFQSLKFAASLKNETTKPDNVKGTTLCMDQFRSLFGSCRIPNEERDEVEVDLESDHVAVLYRNQFYYFRALWPREEGGGDVMVAVSEFDIEETLCAIVKDGNETDLCTSVEGAIGVLTTLPRKQWSKARYQLVNTSEENRSALAVIDSALFVLVLDDFLPKDIHEAAANMLHGTHIMKEDKKDEADTEDGINNFSTNSLLHESMRTSMNHANTNGHSSTVARDYQIGTSCNRWYDKLQLIVCSDGSAGINFEHSAIDGHTALRFASDIFAETVVTFAKSITKSIYTKHCPIPSIVHAKVLRAAVVNGSNRNGKPKLDTNPKKLEFEIVEKLRDTIFFAETSLGDAVNADDTYILEFDKFGKNFIVGNKMSPDSLVQMSIILGYYRLYGEIVCAYEPVITKKYFHGRTEAQRSTTTNTVELCKAWMNRLSSKEEKVNILRESTQNHSRLVKESSDGKGVDRHLYALKCIAETKGLAVPEFFQSDAWRALNHTVLSTSNCGNPALRLFGFGPVVSDGFGIGYIIKDSRIQYSISSKHRQTKRFAFAIRQTLNEIHEFLGSSSAHSMGYHNSESMTAKKKINGEMNSNPSTVEFAEGYDDFYGDTVDAKNDASSMIAAVSKDVSKSPSRKRRSKNPISFVGLARIAGKRSAHTIRDEDASVGTQISDRK